MPVKSNKRCLTQTWQGMRSTKTKEAPLPNITSQLPAVESNNIHIKINPFRKLYTDDMGRFPVRSCRFNHYIMLAYHVNTNAILIKPFQSRNDRHRLAAYDRIMDHLKNAGHKVNLQILDNEASKAYKLNIQDKGNSNFQLVPPNVHRRNASERSIRKFKAHFIAILAGISVSFPNFLWDQLLPQTKLTLNLLRQSTIVPEMSTREHFHGALKFVATPLEPISCPLTIHNKPNI